MSYEVTGPTKIGATGFLNEIVGDVKVTDITTTQGNLLTVGGTSNLTAVATGTAGQVLTSNGPGTEPTFQNSGVVTDESCSVQKDGGDSFSDTPTIVGNWNTTSGFKYNTGSLNLTTGIFTAASSGKFSVKCTINFTNTGASGNSGSRTIELIDTSGPTVIDSVVTQPSGDILIPSSIRLGTDVLLSASDTIAIRFYRSNLSGTNAILTTSTLAIHKIA